MRVLERSVRDIMERDVVRVRPDLPIQDLIGVLEANEITGAPVFEGGRLLRLVTTMGIVAAVAGAAGE